MKTVQIPYDLFLDLAMYHLRGEDAYEEEIRHGLEQKLDAMLNRQLYLPEYCLSAHDPRLGRPLPLLPRRNLHPPRSETLPPPRTGTPIARSLRIRHRTHDLRTLRHRTEMGYRRIIARVFDPCLRVLP